MDPLPALEGKTAVITGASRVEQVHENMKALEVIPLLDDDVLKKIEISVFLKDTSTAADAKSLAAKLSNDKRVRVDGS